MRKLVTGFVVGALLALAPAAAQAQVQVGPTLAFSSDDVGFGIGATLHAQAPGLGEGIGFLGEFLFHFPDGFDFFEINGNVTYAIPLEGSTVLPFVLGGLNISRYSSDVDTGDFGDFFGIGDASFTDVGLNLGGGLSFDLGSARPMAGARIAIGDLNRFVVFATLPFEVGGG